jgi:hypothetical protein
VELRIELVEAHRSFCMQELFAGVLQALDLLPHRIRLRWYIDKNEIQCSDPGSGLHNRSISFIRPLSYGSPPLGCL